MGFSLNFLWILIGLIICSVYLTDLCISVYIYIYTVSEEVHWILLVYLKLSIGFCMASASVCLESRWFFLKVFLGMLTGF